jgi:hypothetical protein
LYYLPAGGTYPPFCEGLQTAWFAAGLQQIFFRGWCQQQPPRPSSVTQMNLTSGRSRNFSAPHIPEFEHMSIST